MLFIDYVTTKLTRYFYLLVFLRSRASLLINEDQNFISSHEDPLSLLRQEADFSAKTTEPTKQVYAGKRPLKCPVCKKLFDTRKILDIHLKKRHTTSDQAELSSLQQKAKDRADKSYFCGQCAMAFSGLKELQNHVKGHAEEVSYKCSQCSKSLATANGLRKHILAHVGNRPFMCEKCAKSFPYESELVAHMRVHTGERPFSCDQCDKSFAQSSNLRQHMSMLHSGARP